MKRQRGSKEWWIIIIAVGALIVSILNVVYTIYITEKGPIDAKPEFLVTVSEQISILNELGGVSFMPFLEIYNTGNAVGRISKIDGTLSLENVFDKKKVKVCSFRIRGQNPILPPSSITINPKESWSARVAFYIPSSETSVGTRTDLTFSIGKEINDQYINTKNNQVPYTISDDLLKKIKDALNENVKDLKKGNYTLTISFWEDPKKQKQIDRKSYKFRLTQNMIDGLKTYQGESYKIPPGFQTNLHIRYLATPALSYITIHKD